MTDSVNEEQTIRVVEARKLLEYDKKSREETCALELIDLLKKHNCTLDVKMVLVPNKHPELISSITAK